MSDTPPVDTPSSQPPQPAPAVAARPKGPRKRLPILIAVLLCVGFAVGYYHWRTDRDQRQVENLKAKLDPSGIDVIFSYEQPDESGFPLFQSMGPTKVVLVKSRTRKLADEDLKDLADINQDMKLMLSNSDVTDNGIGILEGKSHVRWLDLGRTGITDAAIKHLKGMNLESLDLSNTKITDNALATLSEFDLPHLKELIIQGTDVTDAGLSHLGHFKSLEFLVLTKTKVTKSGLRQLRSQIPDVEFPGGM